MDAQPIQETARRARKAIVGSPRKRLCLLADVGTGTQIVAVCFHDVAGSRSKVVKYRANSGRWTKPMWVPTSKLSKADPNEMRYREALASLVG